MQRISNRGRPSLIKVHKPVQGNPALFSSKEYCLSNFLSVIVSLEKLSYLLVKVTATILQVVVNFSFYNPLKSV